MNDPAGTPQPPAPPTDELNRLPVRCYFVRGRNHLAVRAAFGPFYEDYYLHWMQHGVKLTSQGDDLLKDILAAQVLHLATQPHDVTVAWTVNLQDPLINLFATGSNLTGAVAGRLWTEDVREGESGSFHAERVDKSGKRQRSVVQVHQADPFAMVEGFYRDSEQRPARLFRHGPEDFVLVAAQPDGDLDWLAGLDDEAIRRLDKEEELSLLEERHYVFDCGCTVQHMVDRLSVLSGAERDDLFEAGETLRVECPRCGAFFAIDETTYRTVRAGGE